MIDRSVERTSLCKVSINDGENPWIYRLADVNNGALTKVFINDFEPKIFDNRIRLYKQDGPDKNGFFGIWDWNAIPNKTDPNKDYIESYYDDELVPVELCEIKSANDHEGVIRALLDGVSFSPAGLKVMFCTKLQKDPYSGKSFYKGVLCEMNDLAESSDILFLGEDVTNLPAYIVDSQDVFNCENRKFYKYLNLDEPEERVIVKEPVEVVKSILLRRMSWSAIKPYEITKNNWRKIKEFISEIPMETVSQEIAEECCCSEEAAKQFLDRIVLKADEYINQDDFESDTLLKILNGHAELLNKCEAIALQEWERNHQDRLDEANRELDAVREKADVCEKELGVAKAEIKQARDIIASLKEEIRENEDLADRVREKVNIKIHEAQKDAAELIAEMAFFNAPYFSASENISDQDHAAETTYDSAFQYVSESETNTVEYCYEWNDTICELQYGLIDAGVEEKYSAPLAAYLYSAYINHETVLLAGPNGESIVKAFAASVFGQTPGVLDCSSDFSDNLMKKVMCCEAKAVLLKNIFNSSWISHISDFSSEDKQYFIINPFVEDLLIEPASLFSYVIPIITSIFVDSRPSDTYAFFKNTDNYSKYDKKKKEQLYHNVFKRIGVNKLSKNAIQNILTDFHSVSAQIDRDYDYLFAVFPLLYIMNARDAELIDFICDEMAVSRDAKEESFALIGLENE